MMTSNEFADRFYQIATKYKTLYVMGCFGAPITESIAKRYIDGHSYNQKAERRKMITDAIDTECFGFDCICLIKAVLWGWSGDLTHIYGGSVYRSNGVGDINLNLMLDSCSEVSEDFSNIQTGEYLWMDGHCGIYIGNGLAVEATPKWDNKVQITAVGNIGTKEGYNTRSWKKHGKLPYVDYTPVSADVDEKSEETVEDNKSEEVTENITSNEDTIPKDDLQNTDPISDDAQDNLPEEIDDGKIIKPDENLIKRAILIIIKILIKIINAIKDKLSKG